MTTHPRVTNVFNIRNTFNDLVESAANAALAGLNSDFGTSYALDYFFQREVETIPCIRTWFFDLGGFSSGHRNTLRVQVDLFTKSTLKNPDTLLSSIIMSGLLENLKLNTEHVMFYSDYKLTDYYADQSGSTEGSKTFRICPSPSGWMAIPEPEEDTSHYQIDFEIKFK